MLPACTLQKGDWGEQALIIPGTEPSETSQMLQLYTQAVPRKSYNIAWPTLNL